MSHKNNLHENHRKRLLETIEKAGLENLNNYAVMEFLLSIIVPRIDVNPLAHRLIDEFGSIYSVVNSKIEVLKKINGVGERTARLLVQIPHLFTKYQTDKLTNVKVLTNKKDIKYFFYLLLSDKQEEVFFLTCLDKNYRIISNRQIGQGESTYISVNKKDLTAMLVNLPNVSKVLVSHNHPNGTCQPSIKDKLSTDKLISLLKLLEIEFIDHIIVGNDGIYSMADNEAYPLKDIE